MDIIRAGADAVSAAWSEGSVSSPVGPQETVEIALRAAFAEMGLTTTNLETLHVLAGAHFQVGHAAAWQKELCEWAAAVASVEARDA